MLSLCKNVFAPEEWNELKSKLETADSPVMICGLSPLHRALVAAAIQTEFFRPVAVITADETSTASFAADATALSGIDYATLPARELTFHDIEGVSREWEQRRLATLDGLRCGSITAVCGSVEAFSLRTLNPDTFADSILELAVGDEIAPADLAQSLLRLGYLRAETVEGVGQFAYRGGIFDLFCPSMERPVRLEFFGDEIDSIGAFDTATQRRTENMRRLRIIPTRELSPELADGGREAFSARVANLLRGLNRSKLADGLVKKIRTDSEKIAEGLRFAAIDRYLPVFAETAFTALDYLPANTVFFLDDAQRVCEEVRSLARRVTQEQQQLMENGVICGRQRGYYLEPEALFATLSARSAVLLDNFMAQRNELPPKKIFTLISKQLPSLTPNFETLLSDVRYYRQQNFAVLLLASNRDRITHLVGMFNENGISATVDPSVSGPLVPGALTIGVGNLSAGI
ncbi:MAG: hypothetical protein IKU55_02145, partial [Clostridia bacterium]|nr:hypothetical protein [Clostridia bacterium]